MMEKYKSMNQLDSEMKVGNFYCKCLNSGVNSFTGMCGRCGMSKKPKSMAEQVDSQDLQTLIEGISAKKYKTEEMENLISSTPNDQELGEKVRKLFG
jgi:hypothetical protein